MLALLSDKELMREWLVAAEEFCEAKTPDLAAFAIITWNTFSELEVRHRERLATEYPMLSDQAIAARMHAGRIQSVHEMGLSLVTAMRRGRSAKVDRALWNDGNFIERFGGYVDSNSWCLREANLLTETERDNLEERFGEALDRRERQLRRSRPSKPAP